MIKIQKAYFRFQARINILIYLLIFFQIYYFFEKQSINIKITNEIRRTLNEHSNPKPISGNSERIYITMSINTNGVLPTIVTISSLMENSNKCIYDFYIIAEDITNITYQKVKSLEKLYDRLKITFVEHPIQADKFPDVINDGYWPKPTWYRLWAADILPNIDKIIHIDCDCFITGDLDEMYNLNMTDLNVRGVIDPSPHNSKIVKNDKYICTGVILMNLKRMRETKMSKKYEDIIIKYPKKLNFVDQTVFNSVDIENNDLLPLKYGILYVGVSPSSYYYMMRCKDRFTIDDFKDAFANPIIAHLVWKPFHFLIHHPIYLKWWEMAMITCYHEEFKEKYDFYSKYEPLLNMTFINENRKTSCGK